MSLPRGPQAILIGDFLTDPALISAMIESIAKRGARGHLVMVAESGRGKLSFYREY